MHTFTLTGSVALAPPHRQTVGNFVGLCLLVQFPDVPGTITQAEVEAFCNQPGYNAFGNNGSVRDYFHDVSAGKLTYTNIVTPYYTAIHPRSYYTDESIPQPVRALELIQEALTHFKAQGFAFGGLTADDHAAVYAMNVFYAGTRVNSWAKGLWPHSHHLSLPFPLAPGKNAFDYQITDMTDELSLATFCHENGHMICDFPDLYDYGTESSGVGAFCLMCAGGVVDSKNPTDINPYLKYRAGWAQQVTLLAHGQNQSAVAKSNRYFLYRKTQTEYFVIENRTATGRDGALPSQGLGIWHIDETGDNQNEQGTPAQHYECALMQADGRRDLENDNQNIGDATDLFSTAVNSSFGPATVPDSNWWDGTASGLDITGIGAVGASISFHSN